MLEASTSRRRSSSARGDLLASLRLRRGRRREARAVQKISTRRGRRRKSRAYQLKTETLEKYKATADEECPGQGGS